MVTVIALNFPVLTTRVVQGQTYFTSTNGTSLALTDQESKSVVESNGSETSGVDFSEQIEALEARIAELEKPAEAEE